MPQSKRPAKSPDSFVACQSVQLPPRLSPGSLARDAANCAACMLEKRLNDRIMGPVTPPLLACLLLHGRCA